MSPEDVLQTDRIPTIIDNMPRGWNPISQTDDIGSNVAIVPKKTNGHNGSPATPVNGKNGGVHKVDKQPWSPLLKDASPQDPHDSEGDHKSNNNEWASNLSTNLKREIKNGWKEIPQQEDDGTINGHKTNGNGLINGKIQQSTNGHSDKLAEQDPLTGARKPQEIDELSSCGIGSCQPKWARLFASTHVFMVVFLLAWILQVIISNIKHSEI